MKHRMMYALALLIAIALLLAACGSGNAGGNTQDPSETSGQVTLTITSWQADGNQQEVYQMIEEAFQKQHPEISLEYQPVKATEYNTTLNTALQTGSAADIIHLRPYSGAATLADAGYIEPIDGLAGLDVFSDTQLFAAQGSDGKQYGVPFTLSSTQILYNTEIFAANGIEVPTTWDELIQAAETLKANNVVPFAFGSKEGWVLSLMHGAVGPQFYGLDFTEQLLSGETNFESPEFLSSIETMNALTPYFPDNYEGLGMEDIRTMFAAGQAAMVIDGNFEIASILGLNPDLPLDAFPVPSANGGEGTITTWVDGSFGINAASEKKEAAKAYLEFMTTTEFANLIVNEMKVPSPVPGVETDDALLNKLSDWSSSQAVPYMAVTYLSKGDPTTKTTFETAMQGMYLGDLTPEQVVSQVQSSFASWFDPAAQ